jgi:hypothetical protein
MTSASFAPIQARRRSLLWRLHFWSALIASPFAVMAAATGLLYVFTPQIESALYAHLDTVTPQSQAKPLDDAVAAAKQAVPAGWTLHSVMPAQDADDSVKLAFMPPPAKAASMGTHGRRCKSSQQECTGFFTAELWFSFTFHGGLREPVFCRGARPVAAG